MRDQHRSDLSLDKGIQESSAPVCLRQRLSVTLQTRLPLPVGFSRRTFASPSRSSFEPSLEIKDNSGYYTLLLLWGQESYLFRPRLRFSRLMARDLWHFGYQASSNYVHCSCAFPGQHFFHYITFHYIALHPRQPSMASMMLVSLGIHHHPPLVNSPKCNRCSFGRIYLPYDVKREPKRPYRFHKAMPGFVEPVHYSVFHYDLTPKARVELVAGSDGSHQA